MRPSPSAEFAFVLACAGSRRGSPPPGGLDGETLAAIAHRHQLVPLVVEAIRRSGAPIPPPLAARFAPLTALRSAQEAVRLDAALTAIGIVPLFLKGSTLAILAYGALHRRQFGDIDLLVHPDDLARTAALLVEWGYRPENDAPDSFAATIGRGPRFAKDAVLHHPASGQVVELHWRLTDDPWEPPVRADDRQLVTLAPGSALPTLGPEALFAYLCVHGAAHCWARLRWLADVAALLSHAPDGGDRLWQGAVARERGRAAASAILLCGELFGTLPPPAFVRPRSLRLALLMGVARRVIGAGGGATELALTRWRGWAETLAKLLLASCPGDLVGWVMRLLYSPADHGAGGGTALDYLIAPVLRVPRLIGRRRARRHDTGTMRRQ